MSAIYTLKGKPVKVIKVPNTFHPITSNQYNQIIIGLVHGERYTKQEFSSRDEAKEYIINNGGKLS